MSETLSHDVSMTASAAQKINEIIAADGQSSLLRISVEGGGCSGFSYKFDLDTKTSDEDTILERDGAQIAIDAMSLEFLGGSQIDYVDELIGASFQIRNPNATAACGCGTSFSV